MVANAVRRGKGRPNPQPRTKGSREKVAARRYALLQALAASPSTRIADYSGRTGIPSYIVTDDAMRLQKLGLVDVRHGEIHRLFGLWTDAAIWERYSLHRADKMKVARAIVAHIARQSGRGNVRSVVVGPGTAACEVALEMAGRRNLRGFTVITPSLLVVDLLRHREMRLKLAGGPLCRDDAVCQGNDCAAALENYRPHAAVMGFSGLRGNSGTLYCTQEEEVPTLEACLRIPQRYVYLACDTADKIDQVDDYPFGSIGKLSEDGKRIHLFHPRLESESNPDDLRRAEFLEHLEAEIAHFTAHPVPEPDGAEAVEETDD